MKPFESFRPLYMVPLSPRSGVAARRRAQRCPVTACSLRIHPKCLMLFKKQYNNSLCRNLSSAASGLPKWILRVWFAAKTLFRHLDCLLSPRQESLKNGQVVASLRLDQCRARCTVFMSKTNIFSMDHQAGGPTGQIALNPKFIEA